MIFCAHQARVYKLILMATSFLICPAVTRPVAVQVSGVSLSGTVTDSSGAFVAATTITIRNEGTGVLREVTSDSSGFYAAPNLAPGPYQVRVSASGFNTEVQEHINLTVGAQQVLNFTLKVGSATEKIQVTSEAPTVELVSSAITAVVDSTTVRELPRYMVRREWRPGGAYTFLPDHYRWCSPPSRT